MTTEELIAKLKKHPGKSGFLHTAWDDCWEPQIIGTDEEAVFLAVAKGEPEHRNLPEGLWKKR